MYSGTHFYELLMSIGYIGWFLNVHQLLINAAIKYVYNKSTLADRSKILENGYLLVIYIQHLYNSSTSFYILKNIIHIHYLFILYINLHTSIYIHAYIHYIISI